MTSEIHFTYIPRVMLGCKCSILNHIATSFLFSKFFYDYITKKMTIQLFFLNY